MIAKYFLKVLSLLLLAGLLLAACDADAPITPVPEQNRVEVFFWPSEIHKVEASQTLAGEFRGRHPGFDLIDLTAEETEGADPDAVLRYRMLNKEPPDSFQVGIGADLAYTWLRTELMEPLGGLYSEQGWESAFPPQLLEMVSFAGEIYAVPVTVQRANLLWYNKKIFADLGLTPPRSWDELWTVSARIKEAGITPVSIGAQDRWTVLDIFDAMLLANAGADRYAALMAGRAGWDDPAVAESLQQLRQFVALATDASRYLNWEGAVDFVYEGRAAMTIMGDWARHRFELRGGKPDQDYGWLPAPGTGAFFVVVGDAFGLPKGAPHPEAASNFLATAGSLPAQTALAQAVGAIPARVDADRSRFDDYTSEAMASLARDTLVPSAAHGSATIEPFLVKLQETIFDYLATADLNAAQQKIGDAARTTLK